MCQHATMSSGFVSRSHHAISPFELRRAASVDEAVDLVGQGWQPHAGGIDLVAALQRGEEVQQVVDISRLEALRRIRTDGSHLIIGAGATHHDVETSELVQRLRPDLQAAWRTVGNVRIRRAGTVGGNLLAGESGYDAAPILAAVGARLMWSDGSTTTSVDPGPASALLLDIEVPLHGSVRFDRSLKPVVSVAVGPGGVGVGCAGSRPMLFTVDEAVDPRQTVDRCSDDAFASARYRSRMIAVLAARLSEAAA